jgi:hypothetical protein
MAEVRAVFLEYEKKKWANIGKIVGMSAAGCKKVCAEMGLIS